MNVTGAFAYLLSAVFDLYAVIVLARLLLQVARADFYNPVSQFVVRATNPLLLPLRRIIPAAGRLDTASVVLVFVVLIMKMLVIGLVTAGVIVPPTILVVAALRGFVMLVLNFYFFAIIASVILSWIADPYHPVYQILQQVTEPIMAPARRLLPPIGGIDLSPMIVLLAIEVLRVLFRF